MRRAETSREMAEIFRHSSAKNEYAMPPYSA